jgi:hypothetical protein
MCISVPTELSYLSTEPTELSYLSTEPTELSYLSTEPTELSYLSTEPTGLGFVWPYENERYRTYKSSMMMHIQKVPESLLTQT